MGEKQPLAAVVLDVSGMQIAGFAKSGERLIDAASAARIQRRLSAPKQTSQAGTVQQK